MLAAALCGLWTSGTASRASDGTPALAVPRLSGVVRVDGRLTETCYQSHPPLTNFVVAGEPTARPQLTKAWLFWHPDRLVFAFDVTDAQIVAAPESSREHDVDGQDRVELFLWSGRINDTYYCLEVGARGAVHDYAARFYRQFDDEWSPARMKVAVAPTLSGYGVEAELPRAAVEAAGFKLQAGEAFHCGLFRADFQPEQPGRPTWICWVDARGPEPDFHVAGSFGKVLLTDEPKTSTSK